MSRLALARPAVRPAIPARVLVAGPAGLSALRCVLNIATYLGDHVVVVDAGNQESLELADAFDFDVLHHTKPFHPGPLIEILEELDGDVVLVVNNLSAWWTEEGGLSDIGHDGRDGWSKANPLLGRLARAIRYSRGHVLATTRTWSTVHVDVVDGSEAPRLVAGTFTLREDLIRAFTHVLRADASDVVRDLTADRTTTPEDVADEVKERGGAPTLDDEQLDGLKAALEAIPEEQRSKVRQDLADAFGRTSTIPADHLAEAMAFIARHTQQGDTP